MASLWYVFSDVLKYCFYLQKPCGTDHICMVSLQRVFYVLPGFLPVKNTCCSTGNYMAFPQYVFSDAVQDSVSV